jgi:uncharacterized membrane protein YvbJ
MTKLRSFLTSGRSRTLWAAFAGIAIFIVVVVIVVKLFAPQTPPPNAAERQVASFYTAVEHQDYTTAYSLLADQQQAELTLYDFTLFARQQDQKHGVVVAFHEVRYDKDTNNPNQAFIQESVTRAQHFTYVIKLTMKRQPDGSWKILAEDQPI